jgi:1,4-alpha-glucan branching enzyme
MDGVFNHVSAGLDPGIGFPYHWLYQNPSESPFTGGFAQGGYFEELDYNNRCTEQFILDVAKFWLDEYQLDGIRFDYSLGFYLAGEPTLGIPALVSEITEYLGTTHRENVSLMLEHLTDNRYDAINATNAIGATGCWYDQFLWDVPGAAASGSVNTKLMRLLDANRDFGAEKGPVVYVENHDHSTLSYRLGGRDRWWKAQAPLLALFTTPGAVLLHNGQEFGDDYGFPEDGPDRVRPRPVRWSALNDPAGQRLYDLHKQLIRLRRDHPALRSGNFYPGFYDERWNRFNDQGYGVDVERGLAIYHRWGAAADGQIERFIVILNFSEFDQHVDVPFSVNGQWEDVLNGGTVEVNGFRLLGVGIGSNWGKIFYRKG